MIRRNLRNDVEKVLSKRRESLLVPPTIVEYAYYVALVYSHLGPALNISVGLLGAAMLAGLAAYCFLRLGSEAKTVYAPLTPAIACAISFVTIQALAHGVSPMHEYVRGFVTWILTLIIIQPLSLRKGFLKRFVFVTLFIALVSLPYLTFQDGAAGVERAALDHLQGGSASLANPNALAEWFGFFALFFTLVGIETRRDFIRIISWSAAIGCLGVLALTVSRGALFGLALACMFAFRHLLKRSFLPLFILVLLGGLASVSGLLDHSFKMYSERATEETGRLLVWPLAMSRFLDSPVTGVGVADVATHIPGTDEPVTPHNGFLFIALASGIIPLPFMIAYWWRAGRGALQLQSSQTPSAAFYLPLFIYAFVQMMLGNLPFLSTWVTVVLSTPSVAGYRRKPHIAPSRHAELRQRMRFQPRRLTKNWHNADSRRHSPNRPK